MYSTILIPLALDQGHAPRALQVARRLRTEDGKIIAIHVIDQIPNFSNYYISSKNETEIREQAKKGLANRLGNDMDLDVETVVLTGHPGRTVTDYAEKVGADCIIVGSHKPGLKDFFLGSTAARIMRYARCSVHILRLDKKSTKKADKKTGKKK